MEDINTPVNDTKNNYQTKHQLAYNIIRNKILDGTYKPQQRLTMTKLTKETGISTIPIREALKQLEAEGFVKFYQHRGAQVVLYSPEEFEHLNMMRAVLEGLAGRLGTKNITEADIDRMEKLLEQMKQMKQMKQMDLASEQSDWQEKAQTLSQLNHEFHQVLYQAANCEQLLKAIANLWGNTRNSLVIRLANRFIPGYYERDQKEHAVIIAAVNARLPEVVEKLIKDSINNSGKLMTEYLKNPENFLSAKNYDSLGKKKSKEDC
jgi:DNA-binding GntR family transcriptional regulator